MNISSIKIAIIGIGYVGLPLAVEFAKKTKVIAYDINKKRIDELKKNIDVTLEINLKKNKKSKKNLFFTSKQSDLKEANFYIITVPTPIKKNKTPDLSALSYASKIAGKNLLKNDIVVYESTVYPGCTEEFCVPILEKSSKLKFNIDFFCGYSPERINPGDKKHKISNIKKITSGSKPHIATKIDKLYKHIILAGTHKVSSIKIAESAKVIENTQRDLNIALINELSILFDKLKINTEEVLRAAETKWNFLSFRPGLVGGHCIGVDPYYLTYKAKDIGYTPRIILSGREINNQMSKYVSKNFIKELKNKSIEIKNAKILVMGLTFKENCPDLRNSGASKIIEILKKFKCKLDLFDPWARTDDIKKTYNQAPIKKIKLNTYDGIIITVAHHQFRLMGLSRILKFAKKKYVFLDIKNIFF